MSVVTFTGPGPTLTVEAPSVPPQPQFNSPQMADNSNHPLSLQDISSPCSFSTQARVHSNSPAFFRGWIIF